MNIDDVPELEEGFDSRKKFPVTDSPAGADPVLHIDSESMEIDGDETEVSQFSVP